MFGLDLKLNPLFPDDWRQDDSGHWIVVETPDFSKMPSDTERRRALLRRLYWSQRDLNHASSALTFLAEELHESGEIDLEKARRLMSFETTFVVSYSRPFVNAKGGTPPLSFKYLGVKLKGSTRLIHNGIISARNRAVAHTDTEFVPASPMTRMQYSRTDGSQYSMLFPACFEEGSSVASDELTCLRQFLSSISYVTYLALHELHTQFPEEIELCPKTPEEAWKEGLEASDQYWSDESDSA